MDFSVCSQCGLEIEGKGIHFRSRVFCSDDCCEDFEAVVAKRGGPVPEGLDEDLEDDLDEDLDVDDDFDDDEELGYQEGRKSISGGFLDDDFEISPDDF